MLRYHFIQFFCRKFYLLACFNCQLPVSLRAFTEQHTTVHQDKGFIIVDVGNNLTCFCSYKNANQYFWYKQTLDQRLELLATINKHSTTSHFYGDFKENPRFSLEINQSDNYLKISPVQLSDTATYFCAHGDQGNVTFEKGIRVTVKGSTLDVKVSADGSASQSLNCTVFTGGCWDQLSVKESKIPHENLTPQCLKIPRSNHHTCLYNKMIKGKDHIIAELNFCVVASCGHELFRNTTVSHVQGGKDSNLLVNLLSGGLAFTTISILILAFILYTLIKKSRNQPTAVNINQQRRTRRQRNTTNNECVYSRVKH
uniref:Ig-like domain-containing protein n=1 Tax=Gouania willdenowi TaxID=441366 RepID=A0A8C5HJI6_GOUWI